MGKAAVKTDSGYGTKGHSGTFARKMNDRAPEGFEWRDGKYQPKASSAPPAEKTTKAKAPAASAPKFTVHRSDTAAEEFETDRNNTNFDTEIEAPPKRPEALPGPEPKKEPDPAKAEPAAGAPPEEEPKSEEDTFFEQEFPFTFDDDDVERILEMFPLLTIPISEMIARMFGRTVDTSLITMPEWKKAILRPGVKFYGEKILKQICNPKFFFLAIIGFIIWDAILNSVPRPKDPDEQREEMHRAV